MKLKVMLKPNGNGLTPVLCNGDGEPLPGQVSVDIHTAVDDVATVTVTFCMVEFAHEAAVDLAQLEAAR